MGRAVRRLQPAACPGCGGTHIGRIGTNQYYCGDCCVEFQLRRDQVELFGVDEEGNLVLLARQPLEALRRIPSPV